MFNLRLYWNSFPPGLTDGQDECAFEVQPFTPFTYTLIGIRRGWIGNIASQLRALVSIDRYK